MSTNIKVGDLLKVVLYDKTYIGFVFNESQSIWFKLGDKTYRHIVNTVNILETHDGIVKIS